MIADATNLVNDDKRMLVRHKKLLMKSEFLFRYLIGFILFTIE